MDTDYMIYLTSAGSSDNYPNNTPGSFVNRLINPINISPIQELEVSLHSLFYPTDFYLVDKDNGEFYIDITANKTLGKENYMSDKYKYITDDKTTSIKIDNIIDTSYNNRYETEHYKYIPEKKYSE